MEILRGLEPRDFGFADQRLYQFGYRIIILNRAIGLSPIGDNPRDVIFFISKFQISFCELESQSSVSEADVFLLSHSTIPITCRRIRPSTYFTLINSFILTTRFCPAPNFSLQGIWAPYGGSLEIRTLNLLITGELR